MKYSLHLWQTSSFDTSILPELSNTLAIPLFYCYLPPSRMICFSLNSHSCSVSFLINIHYLFCWIVNVMKLCFLKQYGVIMSSVCNGLQYLTSSVCYFTFVPTKKNLLSHIAASYQCNYTWFSNCSGMYFRLFWWNHLSQKKIITENIFNV